METNVKLSENFNLKEFIKVKDEKLKINQLKINNLKNLCEKVLQPIRNEVGPITVISGLRSKEYNELIGGVKNSQHTTGHASDIIFDWSNIDKLRKLIENGLDYDQIIIYLTHLKNIRFIHISIKKGGNRKEQLKCVMYDNEKCYVRINNLNYL